MATSQENIQRANDAGIDGGFFLSMSQLRKLANLDLEKVYIDAGKRPDGVLFQIGLKENGAYSIEMRSYEYGPQKEVQLLDYASDIGALPGFIQIQLGYQLPDEPTFPNGEPISNNNLKYSSHGDGGGAGAAQAYPTPGR